MEFESGLRAIAIALIVMAAIMAVEAAIPLRQRTGWSRRHLFPNLTITLVTFATNLALNVPILLGLLWFEGRGYGLFNLVILNPVVAVIAAVMVLDLAWYATHVTMHRVAALWPWHLIHHSDPFVDVTTTARQHPGESLLRYIYLAAFAFACGVSPEGFAAYKVAQVAFGMFEHANIRLSQRLESVLNLIVTSPAMHKIHHSRQQRLTDSNFGNVFTLWDQLFGTFVHSSQGRSIDYGIDGEDLPARQTVLGLLKRPFIEAKASHAETT
jgi:sterol desaturase/sphingolipid hydroxylase (fatty acid hydroxylase superfamily)